MVERFNQHTAILHLLENLNAGALRRLLSVGDWADHLGGESPTPVVARFLTQLGAEWFDCLPPDSVCSDLAAQVYARLLAHGFAGLHLWAHTLRVTGAALLLAGETGTDSTLVYLAAICHDVAKVDEARTGIPHAEAGAAFAQAALRDCLTPGEVALIGDAITRQSGSTLARILYDADKLDKIGAAGVLRRVVEESALGGPAYALHRVRDDARYFPDMHYDASIALGGRKLAFLDWFLSLADDALAADMG